jgi:hypothetical protein
MRTLKIGARSLIFYTLLSYTIFQICFVSITDRIPSSPNASDEIAVELVKEGRYQGGSWKRLIGSDKNIEKGDLRLHHLPGEPLYLAFCFFFLPVSFHDYIHIPVTLLLIISIIYVAYLICGDSLALISGLFVCLSPFLLIHGFVWDDTYLSASLVWFSIIPVTSILRSELSAQKSTIHKTILYLLLVLSVAYASITRLEALCIFVLTSIMLFILKLPKLRKIALVILWSALCAVNVWGVRNALVSNTFTISSSHDGITLWESVGPHTQEALAIGQVEALSYDHEIMRQYWSETAHMSEVEVNHYFKSMAVEHVISDPTRFLALGIHKTIRSLLGLNPAAKLDSIRNIVGIIYNTIIIFLASIQLISYMVHGRKPLGAVNSQNGVDVVICAVFFISICVSCMLMLLLGPVGWRYKITFDGVMIIMAALTLKRGLERVFRGQSRMDT